MSKEDLQALWDDPANWDSDGSYRCERDPRLIVPRLTESGWTTNRAHPAAARMRAALVASLIAILLGVLAIGAAADRAP